MYFEFSVPIPNIPGKIVLKKKGAYAYVLYQTDRTYDEKRHFNIPKRVIIGKTVAGSTSLIPKSRKSCLHNAPFDLLAF